MPILEELGTLKIKLSKEVDLLTETLSKEIHALTTVREAIALEQSNLKELYQINQNAHILAALLKAQKDKSEQFDQTMEEKKEEWDKKLSQIGSATNICPNSLFAAVILAPHSSKFC